MLVAVASRTGVSSSTTAASKLNTAVTIDASTNNQPQQPPRRATADDGDPRPGITEHAGQIGQHDYRGQEPHGRARRQELEPVEETIAEQFDPTFGAHAEDYGQEAVAVAGVPCLLGATFDQLRVRQSHQFPAQIGQPLVHGRYASLRATPA